MSLYSLGYASTLLASKIYAICYPDAMFWGEHTKIE